MDAQHLIDALIGILLVIGGAMTKVLWDAVKTLQTDLRNIEVALPTNYVSKDEYKGDLREIKDMLTKISDKLDAKADK